MDAFELCRPRIEARGGTANVVVVGHFPHVDRIQEYARLTVLERSCSQPLDTPDPACEYVLPQADFAFVTGVTIINKTAPRLLDLAKNATTVFVGPPVVMSPFLFDWGVEMLAGSVVADPDKARFAVKNGAGAFFGEALADGLARARGRVRNSPLLLHRCGVACGHSEPKGGDSLAVPADRRGPERQDALALPGRRRPGAQRRAVRGRARSWRVAWDRRAGTFSRSAG